VHQQLVLHEGAQGGGGRYDAEEHRAGSWYLMILKFIF
jgi:hypothetical protein